MRRAVRDYKYEVNEGRMTEECIQYLTQLQKDWERHRVKMGVEAMRKEVGDNSTAYVYPFHLIIRGLNYESHRSTNAIVTWRASPPSKMTSLSLHQPLRLIHPRRRILARVLTSSLTN